jgi:hypothetical protein
MKITRRDQALLYVINAVNDGKEFPDVAGFAARVFKLKYETVKADYDAYCAGIPYPRPRKVK